MSILDRIKGMTGTKMTRRFILMTTKNPNNKNLEKEVGELKNALAFICKDKNARFEITKADDGTSIIKLFMQMPIAMNNAYVSMWMNSNIQLKRDYPDIKVTVLDDIDEVIDNAEKK